MTSTRCNGRQDPYGGDVGRGYSAPSSQPRMTRHPMHRLGTLTFTSPIPFPLLRQTRSGLRYNPMNLKLKFSSFGLCQLLLINLDDDSNHGSCVHHQYCWIGWEDHQASIRYLRSLERCRSVLPQSTHAVGSIEVGLDSHSVMA
jgi:hypothetical protein